MSNFLVVDDTPIILSTILKVVEVAGLGFGKIMQAQNGAEAIEIAKADPPNVVIMDIRMPGDVDGPEAATVIRRLHPAARIVFLSAYDDFDCVQRAL